VARRDGPMGGGAWGARGDGMQEMFPALPTPAVPPRPQQLLPRAPSQINSAMLTATVTTKCLCGRRTKQIPAPAPGELPHAPLPCDPDCVRVARRQQLAAAFGQSDTGSCASAQVRACETRLGFLAGGIRWASAHATRMVAADEHRSGLSPRPGCVWFQAAAAFEPSLLRAALAMPQWVELVEEAMASLIGAHDSYAFYPCVVPWGGCSRHTVHE
jgi:hypothetical protein